MIDIHLEPSFKEYENWKSSTITQWFFNKIEQLIREKENTLSMGGAFNRTDPNATQTMTAEYIGFIDGCRSCLEITSEKEE